MNIEAEIILAVVGVSFSANLIFIVYLLKMGAAFNREKEHSARMFQHLGRRDILIRELRGMMREMEEDEGVILKPMECPACTKITLMFDRTEYHNRGWLHTYVCASCGYEENHHESE